MKDWLNNPYSVEILSSLIVVILIGVWGVLKRRTKRSKIIQSLPNEEFKHFVNLLKDIQSDFTKKLGLDRVLVKDLSEYVSLSATLANRIPPHLEAKQRKSLKLGVKVESLNKYLKKNRRFRTAFVVTGEPGSGKTYEMIKLFWDFKDDFVNRNDATIPLFIHFNSVPKDYFTDGSKKVSPKNFLESYFRYNSFKEELITTLDRNYAGQNFLIIIDGLDEIQNKEYYLKTLEALSQWANDKNSPNQYVFSCRSEDYDSKLDVIEIEIQPMTDTQLERLFSKKSRKVPESPLPQEKWRQAWKTLRERDDTEWTRTFLRNPFF